MTTLSITPGRENQYKRFIEQVAERALDQLGLDADGIHRLIEHGDEFQSSITEKIRELSVSNQYFDEEIGSNYGYPKEYKLKPLQTQIETLRDHFSQFSLKCKNWNDAWEGSLLPNGSEGWFAIPQWEKIAPSYERAVEMVLDAIASTRKVYNCCKEMLGSNFLRQRERTTRMLRTLNDKYVVDDILIIPAQFGKRHVGRSARRVCEIFESREFGLGAFAVGCMLLTNPDRITNYEDLFITCPGDESARGGRFDSVPVFCVSGGGIRFDTLPSKHFGNGWGAISGFLP